MWAENEQVILLFRKKKILIAWSAVLVLVFRSHVRTRTTVLCRHATSTRQNDKI